MKKKVLVLHHFAYVPNMSPTNYLAFPKLKMQVNGNQYQYISEIQKSVTVKLKAIPIHEWEKAMKQLTAHLYEHLSRSDSVASV